MHVLAQVSKHIAIRALNILYACGKKSISRCTHVSFLAVVSCKPVVLCKNLEYFGREVVLSMSKTSMISIPLSCLIA